MSSKWRILVALAAFLPVLGCGGGGSSATSPPPAPLAVSITINPASADVGPGQTQQFKATIQNSTNTAVTWKVNGSAGGGGTAGNISASGLYTAPPTTPSPNTATIMAVAKADTSKKASAGILIVPNRAQQVGPIALGASGGNQQDFHISGHSETCCSGTLGALLSRGGNLYILSNNHVLGRENQAKAGEQIDSPGMVDTGCGSGTPVALFAQAVPLPPNGAGTVDAAIAQIVPGTVDPSGSILELDAAGGSPAGAAPPASTPQSPAVGMTVAKSGRTTGLTCGPIQSVSTTVSVDYQQGCGSGTTFKVTFNNQVMVNSVNFSDSGDSGSLVVNATNAAPVALLYAGSNNTTVGNPINDVLGALSNAQGTPTIVGGAPHPVACPATNAGATLQKVQPTQAVLARTTALSNRYSAILMNNPAVLGVGVGASDDSPGDPAIILYLDSSKKAGRLPVTIEGVRTKLIKTTAFAAQSAHESATSAEAVSAAEVLRVASIKQRRVAELMKNPAVFAVGVAASQDSPGEAAMIVYVDQGSAFTLPPVVDGARTKILRTTKIRTFDWKQRGNNPPPRSCNIQKAQSILPKF
jgi:hypothetical protein